MQWINNFNPDKCLKKSNIAKFVPQSIMDNSNFSTSTMAMTLLASNVDPILQEKINNWNITKHYIV